MKKVFIIHGWGGSPDEPLHKWLKNSLEKAGYTVIVPLMPSSEIPRINSWVNKLKEVASNIDEETVFTAHSIGCQAVLRYLETLEGNIKIKGILLIAPWMELDMQTILEEGEEVVEIARPWIETPIDFEKVKMHVKNIKAIFSDNDPYVPVSQKDLFARELNAEILIEHKKGHFDEESWDGKLPSALESLLNM